MVFAAARAYYLVAKFERLVGVAALPELVDQDCLAAVLVVAVSAA